jgi:phasin family protein
MDMTTKGKAKDTAGPDAAAMAAAEAMDTMMAAGKETAEAAVKAGTEAATEAYEAAVSFGENQFRKSAEGYKTATAFGKENLASVNAVASAVTSGMEAYGEQVASYTKAAASENLELVNKLMSAKTPEELAALQMEAVTRSVDRMVGQSIALNKILAETWMQSAAPVKARMDAAMQAFSKSFAA